MKESCNINFIGNISIKKLILLSYSFSIKMRRLELSSWHMAFKTMAYCLQILVEDLNEIMFIER